MQGLPMQTTAASGAATVSARYSSGYRYTPQNLVGYNDLGRPQFEVDNSRFLEGRGAYWFTMDAKASYQLVTLGGGTRSGLEC